MQGSTQKATVYSVTRLSEKDYVVSVRLGEIDTSDAADTIVSF